jgi:hypothetical protein
MTSRLQQPSLSLLLFLRALLHLLLQHRPASEAQDREISPVFVLSLAAMDTVRRVRVPVQLPVPQFLRHQLQVLMACPLQVKTTHMKDYAAFAVIMDIAHQARVLPMVYRSHLHQSHIHRLHIHRRHLQQRYLQRRYLQRHHQQQRPHTRQPHLHLSNFQLHIATCHGCCVCLIMGFSQMGISFILFRVGYYIVGLGLENSGPNRSAASKSRELQREFSE